MKLRTLTGMILALCVGIFLGIEVTARQWRRDYARLQRLSIAQLERASLRRAP